MNVRRALIFVSWSLLTIAVTGALLFWFTFGDCFEEMACRQGKSLSTALILGGGFLIYWAVNIALFLRWNTEPGIQQPEDTGVTG